MCYGHILVIELEEADRKKQHGFKRIVEEITNELQNDSCFIYRHKMAFMMDSFADGVKIQRMVLFFFKLFLNVGDLGS